MICPMRLVDDEAMILINFWYPHYCRRLLPVAGGLLDQSAYFLDAMQLIEANY